MNQGLFITGTSTDVGKTLVTAGVFRAALRHKVDCCAVKPVQSGCPEAASGEWIAPDAVLYEQAAGRLGERAHISVLHSFLPACSPHLAARMADKKITVDQLKQDIDGIAGNADFTIVEGAGGLLVPLNEGETMLDLIRGVDFPVLMVADNRLGVINHSLLSLEVLRRENIPVAGVVLNHCSLTTPENHFIREENPRAISAFGKTNILASFPYNPDWCPEKEEFWQRTDAEFDRLWGEVAQ